MTQPQRSKLLNKHDNESTVIKLKIAVLCMPKAPLIVSSEAESPKIPSFPFITYLAISTGSLPDGKLSNL